MTEAEAWLAQAEADLWAAERFGPEVAAADRCHVTAKYQQAVEKSVKAMAAALDEAGVATVARGRGHEVARAVQLLVRRMPRADVNRPAWQHLSALFDAPTRAGVAAVDAVFPQLPPRRNTEYPFPSAGGWTYPADPGTFSAGEVERFRHLGTRLVNGARGLRSLLRRQPRG